jgi:hypothetical protein
MIANALPRPLTAGSVDNAILRADGTDGTILQSSSLVIEDVVDSFAFTCNGDTDIFTAVGHNFSTNQRVMFSGLGGNYGPLNTTTIYFVRNISGNTFQISTTSGGSAINIGAGASNGNIFAIQPNVTLTPSGNATAYALVLNPKGASTLIIGNKPDGTSTGGGQRGGASFDFSSSRTTVNQIASGFASFLMGNECTASANFSLAFGYRANATGAQSIAGAWENTASASGSMAWGGTANIANAQYATVVNGQNNRAQAQSTIGFGENSNADRRSMIAHAGGQFWTFGDAQRSCFVMRNKTTTNSAVELFLDGSSTRLTIPSGKVLGLTINITGISSTGAAVAHYMRQYALKNVAGTCTEVYAPVTIGTDNAAGTSIALSAYDVGAVEALRVEVTGTASTIWRWVASVDAVEIAFGT